jgi:hypothetical protein
MTNVRKDNHLELQSAFVYDRRRCSLRDDRAEQRDQLASAGRQRRRDHISYCS